MTVRDCMRKIARIKDAESILHDYEHGTMSGIAKQHLDEIRELLDQYMDFLTEMKIQT